MLDTRIKKFIKAHHVLTLASAAGNVPWTANCFYVYIEELNMLAFTSDSHTRHVKEIEENPMVAGSIVLETKAIGKLQGIQFSGKMFEPDDRLYKKAKIAYLKRFPVAMLMKTMLWVVELSYVKMTDNRLGFGKKLIWDRESNESVIRDRNTNQKEE